MNDRVITWLESLGLDRYRDVFQQNAVTWDVLSELNDDDLASMGVLLGHRKKLLRAIAQLPQGREGEGTSPQSITTGLEGQPCIPGHGQGERRQLTVMFCDLVGSTALARRLDPEDLQAAIRRFLDVCGQAVTRFNGYIAKYMGDGLLVYFGYPHAHEHDAERAIHAGLAVLELVKALPGENISDQGHEIAARIGIATGHVMVGEVIGQETAKERSVFGETPNLAARLQALAMPNQLVVDSATKRLVGSEFDCVDKGEFSLKGFDVPVQVWQVLGATPSASRFESYRSARLANFIGREQETALLLGRWREAVNGEGQVVLLCGEAGIGKSRLARSLRERLEDERCQTIELQCSPYHTNTALYPVIQFLRQAAGLTGNDSPQIQRQKVDALTSKNGVDDQKTGSLLADLLSIHADARYPSPNASPETRKEWTLEALVQQLQRLAGHCPTLFIVEDAHWLDPTTMDLLTRTIDRIQQMRVLLLITFRPNFKPAWTEYGHVTFLTLSRLPRRHSIKLLASMTGGKALPPEVEQVILSKTDGVPLYIEELTENMLESGLLTEGSDSFSWRCSLKDVAIPNSLQALLMERVDRLGPAKEIVQIGAAIGREFTYELLRAIVSVSDSELARALDLFTDSGLILQDGHIPLARYHFKHALVQEAAYNTLPKKSRRMLHARIAKILEDKFAERVETEPELLAHHSEQAGLSEAALTYWHRAARRDAGLSANREAINHYNNALAMLKDLPESRQRDAVELDLLIERGAPMVTVKGYASQEIERNYLRAREISHADSHSEQHFFSVWGLWVFRLVRGPLVQACELAENLLSLAERRQNPDLLIRAYESVGSTYSFLGRFDEAKTHLLAAKSLFDPTRHHGQNLPYTQDPGITARIILARTLWILGEVDEVDTMLQEAIDMARELEHPFTLAFALATACWISSTLHEAERTRSLADEAIAISMKYSFDLGLAWATSSQGWALVEMGHEEGFSKLFDGISAKQAAGASLNSTHTLALLAELYLQRKRIDEGLGTIQEALEIVSVQGEQFWKAELLRLKGELLLEQSDHSVSDAEQCFIEALKTAQDQGARMLELRAAISAANFLRGQNRLDEATRVLQSARSWFNERIVNRELTEAQTLLAQLGG